MLIERTASTDLADGGAAHFADTIRRLKQK